MRPSEPYHARRHGVHARCPAFSLLTCSPPFLSVVMSCCNKTLHPSIWKRDPLRWWCVMKIEEQHKKVLTKRVNSPTKRNLTCNLTHRFSMYLMWVMRKRSMWKGMRSWERERETVCSVCTFCVNSLLPSFSAFCISKSVLLFFFFLFLLLQSLHHNVIIIIPPPFQSREECRTVIQTRIMYCVSWRHSFVRKNESEWKRSMLLVPMMRKSVKHNQCKKKELQFHVVYLSLLIRWR